MGSTLWRILTISGGAECSGLLAILPILFICNLQSCAQKFWSV